MNKLIHISTNLPDSDWSATLNNPDNICQLESTYPLARGTIYGEGANWGCYPQCDYEDHVPTLEGADYDTINCWWGDGSSFCNDMGHFTFPPTGATRSDVRNRLRHVFYMPDAVQNDCYMAINLNHEQRINYTSPVWHTTQVSPARLGWIWVHTKPYDHWFEEFLEDWLDRIEYLFQPE